MSDAGLISAVFVGVMFAFYLMFLRPIQKEQQQHKKEIRELKPGDEILTQSGFFGRIKDIQIPESGQTRIFIELADGVVVKALTNSIAYRLDSRPAEAPKAAEAPLPSESTQPEQRGLAQ